MNDTLYQITTWVLPVLFAVTFHEASHGFVAWRLGDDTAWRLGRVTFNPLRHVDLFGTVVLPAMLLLASGGRMMFGFAKPVPVNFARLRRPRRDMVLVAAAGPGINLAMALLAAVLVARLPAQPSDALEWIGYNLFNAVWINVLLAVFNMLPIPPLDGGRVAVGLLPRPLAMRLARLERVGILIVIGALFLLPAIGQSIGLNLDLFRSVVVPIVNWIYRGIALMTGI